MQDYKKLFPIFAENPDLIYLDNAASTQKPSLVIEWVDRFVRQDYANIHRGIYSLSQRSEDYYYQSKILLSSLINSKPEEIIYTYNASYAINLLAQSLVQSNFLQKWDVVLLWTWDHHANILPWMALAKLIGFEIQWIPLDVDFSIDRESFEKMDLTSIKVVACSQLSNVTGMLYDISNLKSKLSADTFFLIDASQSVPHISIDFEGLGVDAVVFTGHKMMAYTGIGVLALKWSWIKKLEPLIVGGGTIEDVSIEGYHLLGTNEKFETGTPNIIGAVSFYYALLFIQSLADEPTLSQREQLKKGMQIIQGREKTLTDFAVQEFRALGDQIQILGSLEGERIALFSFMLREHKNFNQIGEFFAAHNIAIRCGGHCAYPLHKNYDFRGTCRMSAYLYNDLEDLTIFFEKLKFLLK